MTSAGYLRVPHLHGDLLTFAADDDVWLGPLAGGQAWRVSSDRSPVSHPRLSRDGSLLAWTSARDGAPEVHVCELDGGRARRLTHWGDSGTRLAGWTPGGEIIALTAAWQPFERFAHAYLLGADGGAPRRQAFGPVADLAIEPAGTALLNGTGGARPGVLEALPGRNSGAALGPAGGAGRAGRVPPDPRRPGRSAGQPDAGGGQARVPVRP